MDFFESLNLYLMHHPAMLEQLEFAFRIKWWCLFLLLLVFLRLAAYGSQGKPKKTESNDDQFLA